MNQQQLILRLPDELSLKIRSIMSNISNQENSNTITSNSSNSTNSTTTGTGTATSISSHSLIEMKYANDTKFPDKFFVSILDNVGKANDTNAVDTNQKEGSTTQYPALLVNLPCPVETHRTFDNKTLYKSADIGQALQVFLSEEEFLNFYYNKMDKLDGIYYADRGLSIPSINIINRKYNNTRKQTPFPPDVVKESFEDILNFASNKEVTEVYEEVVDFEEFMYDERTEQGAVINISYTTSTAPAKSINIYSKPQDRELLENHPEILSFSRLDDIERVGGVLPQIELDPTCKTVDEIREYEATCVVPVKCDDDKEGVDTESGNDNGSSDQDAANEFGAMNSAIDAGFADLGIEQEIYDEQMEESEDEAGDQAETTALNTSVEEVEGDGEDVEYNAQNYTTECDGDGDGPTPGETRAEWSVSPVPENEVNAEQADGGSDSSSDSSFDDEWLEDLNNR